MIKRTPQVTANSKHDEVAPNQEKEKIKAAILTDFILSVEIVIIALGTVTDQSSMVQILTTSAVALVATVGVYGLLALIVRMDDMGYKLINGSNSKGFLSTLGHGLLGALPVIIRLLSIVGTLALLLVAGGIFSHNIPYLHALLPTLAALVKEFGIGLVAGLVIAGIFTLFRALRLFSGTADSDGTPEDKSR